MNDKRAVEEMTGMELDQAVVRVKWPDAKCLGAGWKSGQVHIYSAKASYHPSRAFPDWHDGHDEECGCNEHLDWQKEGEILAWANAADKVIEAEYTLSQMGPFWCWATSRNNSDVIVSPRFGTRDAALESAKCDYVQRNTRPAASSAEPSVVEARSKHNLRVGNGIVSQCSCGWTRTVTGSENAEQMHAGHVQAVMYRLSKPAPAPEQGDEREIVLKHLMKRAIEEVPNATGFFIRRVTSGEHDVPSPWRIDELQRLTSASAKDESRTCKPWAEVKADVRAKSEEKGEDFRYVYTGPGGIDPQTAHEAEVGNLKEEISRLQVQLAGCGVAASGWATGDNRAKQGDYGWSPAFEDIMKLREHSWRCFHCGFFTLDEKQAAAHFGDRDDAEEFKPLCKWWQCMDEGERASALQDMIAQRNEAWEDADASLRTELAAAQERIRDTEASLRKLALSWFEAAAFHCREQEHSNNSLIIGNHTGKYAAFERCAKELDAALRTYADAKGEGNGN